MKVQVGVELNVSARDGEAHRSAAIATELIAEVAAIREKVSALQVEGWEIVCIGPIAARKRSIIVLVSFWGSSPRD